MGGGSSRSTTQTTLMPSSSVFQVAGLSRTKLSSPALQVTRRAVSGGTGPDAALMVTVNWGTGSVGHPPSPPTPPPALPPLPAGSSQPAMGAPAATAPAAKAPTARKNFAPLTATPPPGQVARRADR